MQHLARLPSHQGGVVPTPRRARRLHRRKVRGNSMQRRQIRMVSTLDELMRRRSSSTGTGNLTGGDTVAGRGAAVAGGNLIGGDTLATLAGRRAAIAASSETACVNICRLQAHVALNYLPRDGGASPACDSPSSGDPTWLFFHRSRSGSSFRGRTPSHCQ